MPKLELVIRPVRAQDAPLLERVRVAAFASVFASFRSILGDELYDLAQRRDDDAQGELLASIIKPVSGWKSSWPSLVVL